MSILSLTIDLLRQRIAAHQQAQDLDAWVQQSLLGDVEKMLGGPLIAKMIDLLRLMEDDPCCDSFSIPPGAAGAVTADGSFLCPRDALYGLLRYLLDESHSPQPFLSSVSSLADTIQLLLNDVDLVPVLRTVGQALDPQRGLVAAALHFLQPALVQDRGQSLLRILRNAYQETAPGKIPVDVLLEITTQIHRLAPGSDGSYRGPDVQQALGQVIEFLVDEERGLEKFFNIVKDRCDGRPCPLPPP
jgi:hypothetical protein